MSYKKISSAIFTLFIFTFAFQRCSDDTIAPSGNSVTGKVVDSDNLPISNLKVKIGDRSTLSSSDGSFKFDNVSFPYDLALINSQNKRYFLYKGLSTTNVKTPNYYLSPASWHVAVLNVNIPAGILPSGTKGKIIFTDTKEINEIQDLQIHNLLNIPLPDLNNNYPGKLIVLTYKADNNGNILSYENYGESEMININSYSNLFYDFTSNQLSLDPGEMSISGTIKHPTGLNSVEGDFFLAFNTKRVNYISSELRFANIGDVFKFNIPSNLPSDFSVIISNESTDGINRTFERFKVDKNAQGINLMTKIPPAAISPENNATDVNASTVFSFSPGEGEGIFYLSFSDNQNNVACNIITGSNSITFSEVMNLIEDDISNSNFLWTAAKIGPNNNVNEYMTTFSDKQAYFGSSTGARAFNTSP